MGRLLSCLALVAGLTFLSPAVVMAQSAMTIKPLAEKKVDSLPSGTLFWRIENLPSLPAAQASVGPFSVAVEAAGKAWLFTLGPQGGSTAGAAMVAEVGRSRASRPRSTCCASMT
jgi:hypothetical protein